MLCLCLFVFLSLEIERRWVKGEEGETGQVVLGERRWCYDVVLCVRKEHKVGYSTHSLVVGTTRVEHRIMLRL